MDLKNNALKCIERILTLRDAKASLRDELRLRVTHVQLLYMRWMCGGFEREVGGAMRRGEVAAAGGCAAAAFPFRCST